MMPAPVLTGCIIYNRHDVVEDPGITLSSFVRLHFGVGGVLKAVLDA
ncbi:unnamed protein product [Ascophyllum nodosum]